MKNNTCKKLIAFLCLSFFITACGGTDAKIDKLDSLCDDYVENIRKGRLHDAEAIKDKMGKYWDVMNELNRENKLTEQQKEKLDEIETRMFDARFESNR